MAGPARSRVVALLLVFLAFGPQGALAETPSKDRLEALTRRHAGESFSELRELLSMPNDAHPPDQVEANLLWVKEAFEDRGFSARVLPTSGPPLLLAERRFAGAERTVLVYLQIDGQPVDPARWDQDLVGSWLRRAMVRAFGEEPIRKRMSGGSIPISPLIRTLGVPAVTVPTVNADNNQHSPNENLRVGNYVDGIKTFLAILTEPIHPR